MLTDGLKSQNLEEKIHLQDVAEILERACEEEIAVPAQDPPPPPPSPEPEKPAEIQAAE